MSDNPYLDRPVQNRLRNLLPNSQEQSVKLKAKRITWSGKALEEEQFYNTARERRDNEEK